MEKFEEHDSIGIGMAISAMSVVFSGLLLLYISFKIIGKISVNLSKRNAMRAKGITDKKRLKKTTGRSTGWSIRSHFPGIARNAEWCTRCGRHRTHHYPRKTQLFTLEFKDLHVAWNPSEKVKSPLIKIKRWKNINTKSTVTHIKLLLEILKTTSLT